MTTIRQQRANQQNARSSTGPRSPAGKAKSAANARRHGLAIPIWSDHKLSAEAEALAHEIAGVGASQHRLELARPIAEAQIEISRVAQAKHNLLERSLINPDYYSAKEAHKRTTDLIRLDKYLQKSLDPPEDLLWVLETPDGPEKFALIISDLSRRLAAIDRYERRALSRRKFAIRAFDKAVSDLIPPAETAGKATGPGLVGEKQAPTI